MPSFQSIVRAKSSVGRSTLRPNGDAADACWCAWLDRIGGMDDRLRRNAADIEAGAAQPALAPALLDEHDVEAELAGPDRRDVAAGTAADDHHLGRNLGHLTPQ